MYKCVKTLWSLMKPETVNGTPSAVTVKAEAGGRLDSCRSLENLNMMFSPLKRTRAFPSVGGPVSWTGAVGLPTEDSLMTAGTPPEPVVKEAASLPAVSWMALASSPEVGVGVGDDNGLALADGRRNRNIKKT